ncbi:Protein of unknown function [Gryllus bimaculatus]|nr:Protein of unknown function [Gryllus bimaculatus]
MGSDCLPFFRTRQSQAVQFPLLPTSSQHPTHAVLLSAVRNIRHGGLRKKEARSNSWGGGEASVTALR